MKTEDLHHQTGEQQEQMLDDLKISAGMNLEIEKFNNAKRKDAIGKKGWRTWIYDEEGRIIGAKELKYDEEGKPCWEHIKF